MAISGNDGSIILKTAVDTAGLAKGLKGISGFAKTAAKGFLLLAGAITAVTGLAVKAYAEFEQLAGGTELLFGSAYKTVMQNAKEAYKTVQMSQNEYLRQVNGFAVGLKTSLGGNEQAAADLAHKIVVAEADIIAATGNTQENVQNAFNGIMKSNFTMLDNLQLGIKPTKEGMQEVIDKVNAWNAANGNATKYQMGNLADMQSAIVDYVEMQGMAGYAAREAADTIQGSTAMMKASWENLLIAMSTGEGLNEAVDALVDSLDRVVNNIAPVIERVLYGLAQAVQRALPALVQTITTALIQQIPTLVVAVYNMIIGLFKGLILGVKALFTGGGTSTAMESIEESVSKISGGASSASDGMDDLANSTKKAGEEAKDAKKAFGDFDDLTIVSEKDSGSSSSGSDGGSSAGTGIPEVGTGGMGDLDLGLKDQAQQISEELNNIMAIAGAALLAIGLLLLFFGNIGWGIGFIITGAITFGVAASNSAKFGISEEIVGVLTTIMGIAGGALLALGIILLWVGGVVGMGVAIGMIIAGAALIVGAVATQAAFSPGDIQGWLSLIMGIAGGALLALGIILCMVGSVPIGVGMIIAGSVSLVSAVALNFNSVKNSITGWVAAIMAIAGAAMLVLGIVLCVSGAGLAIGIALIAAGAVALVTPIALNWNYLVTTITDFFNQNVGLIAGIAVALLILGVLILLTGVGTPLGIGLIIAGSGALGVMAATLDWTYLVTEIKNFFTENAGLISGIAIALVILGIILLLTGVGIPLAIGLIVAGGGVLAAEAALHWDYIVQSVTEFLNDNAALIVGIAIALVIIGIVLLFTGVGIPLAIGLIIAGGAALATEVALNWDFIKEKVTSFFTTLFDWVKTWGLLILGIILVITGVGIPLGIALMIKGGANLSEAQDPLWTAIVDKVKSAWEAIKAFWKAHIAKWFTKEHWAGLAKNIMNGLIGIIEKGLNWIIDKLNTLSWDVPDWVPLIGGKKWGFDINHITIPRLARGAVIPPNKEFLAVLGDQKQGVNIEAPLQTIVDAFNIALAQNGGSGGGTTEVILEIDGREFGRAVVEQGNRENRRIGTRLVIA